MASEKDLIQEKAKYNLPTDLSASELLKLKSGMPVQKIMGFIQFDKVRINLNYNVLIPRYETEEVVYEAIKYINSASDVLDLCTGSGFIGLTIKKLTNTNVVMSDVDQEAIFQSQENAKLNNLDVKIIKSDMFSQINQKFDVIVSNPPYIPFKNKLPESVLKFEPERALFAKEDGNYFYKIIMNNAEKYLKKNGLLVLEISADNLEYLKKFDFKFKKDINGKPRIAIKKF